MRRAQGRATENGPMESRAHILSKSVRQRRCDWGANKPNRALHRTGSMMEPLQNLERGPGMETVSYCFPLAALKACVTRATAPWGLRGHSGWGPPLGPHSEWKVVDPKVCQRKGYTMKAAGGWPILKVPEGQRSWVLRGAGACKPR